MEHQRMAECLDDSHGNGIRVIACNDLDYQRWC